MKDCQNKLKQKEMFRQQNEKKSNVAYFRSKKTIAQ